MDIADILIYVHSDLPAAQREAIEEAVRACTGVVSAHFGPAQPHGLTVAYDPEAVTSGRLLGVVKRWDRASTMAGL